jgi:hypothetical protein
MKIETIPVFGEFKEWLSPIMAALNFISKPNTSDVSDTCPGRRVGYL